MNGSKLPNSAIARFKRRVAPQDERAGALLLGRRLGLAPAMAAGVEDERQPGVGVGQRRLDDDAAQEAVEHDDVERLERLGNVGEDRVELGELGVAQVLVGGGDGAARRRLRFRLAHRRLRARRSSIGEPRGDASAHFGQLGRQAMRELAEQLVVEGELAGPGVAVDAADQRVAGRVEVEAGPVEVARSAASGRRR